MVSNGEAEDNGGRRAERHPVDAATRLRPNNWSSLEVQMLDLSRFGFRASCEARVQPGGCVSLDVPGIGTVEAQVEWQRGGEFGARFFDEIPLENCGWTVDDRRQALARLLVERAGAKRAGRSGAEFHLRRQILSALPMRKGRASA